MGQLGLSIHQGPLHSSLLQEASLTAPGLRSLLKTVAEHTAWVRQSAIGPMICPSLTGIQVWSVSLTGMIYLGFPGFMSLHYLFY